MPDRQCVGLGVRRVNELSAVGRLVHSMYWTPPIALFFAGILAMLALMTTLEVVWPTCERRGFLPMTTTRGDRLFIGLLSGAWIHLAWIGLASAPLWGASLLASLWLLFVLRWG